MDDQEILKIIARLIQPKVEKDHHLARDIVIQNLDELCTHLIDKEGKLILTRSQLGPALLQFLDHENDETSEDDETFEGKQDVDIDTLEDGQIVLSYFESGGQGGSTFFESTFKHNNRIVTFGYCSFGSSIESDCYNTQLTFSIKDL